MTSWFQRFLDNPEFQEMGHGQRQSDANLGMGWLYYALARVLRPERSVVIGSYRGFVPILIAKALSDNLEGGTVTFIDPSLYDSFWTDPGRVEAHFARFGVHNIRHFLMTTQQFVGSAEYETLDDIGLVFIDGLHTYDQARFDFEAFAAKLSPLGYVLFHDSTKLMFEGAYGLAKAHVIDVVLLMEELRDSAQWQVLGLPFSSGLSIVTRRRPDMLTKWGLGAPDADVFKKGVQHFNARRFADAQGCFNELLSARPTDGRMWLYEGAAAAMAGRLSEALQSFQRADECGCQPAKYVKRTCERLLRERMSAREEASHDREAPPRSA